MDRIERWLPATGIAYVVLGLIGVIVGGSQPDFLPSAEEAREYFVDNSGQVTVSGVLWLLALVPLVWFYGVLRSRFRPVEGPDDRLTWTGSVAGVVGAGIVAVATTFQILGGLRADEDGDLAAGYAQVLWDLGSVFYGIAAPILLGASLLAFSVLALRRRAVLPVWLAWAGVVFAVIAFIPPIAWIFIFLLYNLWILVAAVVLLRSSDEHDERVVAQYTEVTQVTVTVDEEE